MNKSFLEDSLRSLHSKKSVLKIVKYIGHDHKKFDELIDFCFGEDELLAQRAAWPLRYCAENNPGFADKHVKKILKRLRKPGHNGIRRGLLCTMEHMDIKGRYAAESISICFELMNNRKEFIAVKVFAMAMLAKFCKKYPEIAGELKSSIETGMDFETAAFRSRGRRILNQLNKQK